MRMPAWRVVRCDAIELDERGGPPPGACRRSGPHVDRCGRANRRARPARPRLDLAEGQPPRQRPLDRSVPGADCAAARLRRRRGARARRKGHRRGRGRPEVAKRSLVQRREMRWNPRRKRGARQPGRRLCGRRRRQLRAGAGGPRLPDDMPHARERNGGQPRRLVRATRCSGSTRRSASGAPERRSRAFAPRGSIAPSVLADPS